MLCDRVWRVASLKGHGALSFAGVATSGWCARSHQNTPLPLTALSTETVTVTDPTHPLYGLTLPLHGITTKQRLGRVCVIWLYPGVERVIPLGATSLAESPSPPSPCRLSIAGVEALLTVIASLADHCQEDAHVDTRRPCDPEQPATLLTVARPGTLLPSAPRTTRAAPPTPVDESLPYDACTGPSHNPSHHTGGTP
jgi:hypothetical protein